MADILEKIFLLLALTAALTILVVSYSLYTFSGSLVTHTLTRGYRSINIPTTLPTKESITLSLSIKKDYSFCSPVHVLLLPGSWMSASDSGYQEVDCDVPCMYSKDTRSTAIKLADAAVVYLPTYSGHPNNLLRKHGLNVSKVLKVGLTMESVHSYPRQFDYISDYDIEVSYRMTSDVPNPYFTFARGKQNLLEDPHSGWKEREKAVVFIARNCKSTDHREELLKALQKYVRVDSVSNCLHNKDWPTDIVPRTDKRGLLRHYMALLAAENSVEDDYVTEKVYAGLITGAIPIYYGARNIDQFVPPDSIIKVPYPYSNASIREVSRKIQHVMTSEQEYNRLTGFKRLNNYQESFLKMFNFTRIDVKCRLCQKIMSLKCRT